MPVTISDEEARLLVVLLGNEIIKMMDARRWRIGKGLSVEGFDPHIAMLEALQKQLENDVGKAEVHLNYDPGTPTPCPSGKVEVSKFVKLDWIHADEGETD